MRALALALALSALGLGVLGTTSASAEQITYPGRNGKLVFAQTCKDYRGSGEGRSCARHFASMSADGSSFRLLSPNKTFSDYDARYSPDGRSLLDGGGSFGDLPTSIGAVRLVGGKRTTIYSGLRSLRNELSVTSGDWLPDGKRIAFLGYKRSRTGIYTIGVDGKGLRTIRVFPDRSSRAGGPTIGGLMVSPNGRRFAFGRGTEAGVTLYVMNANGSGLKRIMTRCAIGAQDWSPDSKRLLVSIPEYPKQTCLSGPPTFGLYIVSASSGAATRVYTEKRFETPNPPWAPEESGLKPPLGVFSPDGTRIAFMVQRWPGAEALYNTIMVMRANGTDVRTVRKGEARIVPDGAFQVCTRCVSFTGLGWQRIAR
jgi:Tol biopolymer transport system component